MNNVIGKVKRSAVNLVSLQHAINKKEKELLAYRSSSSTKCNFLYTEVFCFIFCLVVQNPRVLDISTTDLLVKSTSQQNNRIKEEIEAQLLVAKQLAEAEQAANAAAALSANANLVTAANTPVTTNSVLEPEKSTFKVFYILDTFTLCNTPISPLDRRERQML